MADYPDYTTLMQIIGSDIMVPIDVQGAYIMMPVDIQAQYVTLDIDIVAQTVGNIAIDIKAQTVGNIAVNVAAAVTLNVNISSITGGVTFNIGTIAGTVNMDITAQTIGNLTIDFEAQSVGIFLQPEWAAKTNIDKEFQAEATKASGQFESGTYNVPAGKTLYMCGISFVIQATVIADRNKNQMGAALIKNETDAKDLAYIGGNGGGGMSFPKPIVLDANKQLVYRVYNWAEHECHIEVTTWGYEI